MTELLCPLRSAQTSARCFVLVAALIAFALSAPAQAQDAYHDLLDDAERELAEGNPAEARDLYRRAQAQAPGAAPLYGIAVTSRALDDHAEAVRSARAALAQKTTALPAALQQVLLDLIDKSRPLVSELIVESTPNDVQIAVDGEVIPLGPQGELVIAPGRHTIRALADGYMPFLSEISLRAGVRDTLTVELVQPYRPSALYADEEDDEADEDEGGPSLVVPIVLVSIGGATLLAGGITALVALDNEGDLENRCGAAPGFCPKHNSAVAHSAEDLAVATNVLWVVGGLTAAVGVTWLVLALTDDEHAPEASLDLGPGHAGLRVSGQL